MFLTRLKAYLGLSSVRQALGLMGVFVLCSLAAWSGTYWLVSREMMQAVDARLNQRMIAATGALAEGWPLPSPGPGQAAFFMSGGGPEGVMTFHPNGKYDPEYRYMARNTVHGRIVLGEDVEREEEVREILSGGMMTTGIAMAFSALLAGAWVGYRGQRRLDRISGGLAQVAQGHLETRITLEGRRDDLSILADRINSTTARLERAMAQVRVQSSNIAHDLRTPLARLRARIETSLIGLSEEARPVEIEDLGEALEQIDQITGTFDALLRLARVESGAGRAAFAPVDLAALLAQSAETFGPVIEDGGQHLRLEVQEPAQIHGDRDLLVQLVANLLQNAMRYGPEGQEILLRLHGHRLSVSDQGPGVPFEEREKVLEPLYQREGARQGPGYGLGLAMVRAICELHEASLSLADGPNGRGLRVTVEFARLAEG